MSVTPTPVTTAAPMAVEAAVTAPTVATTASDEAVTTTKKRAGRSRSKPAKEGSTRKRGSTPAKKRQMTRKATPKRSTSKSRESGSKRSSSTAPKKRTRTPSTTTGKRGSSGKSRSKSVEKKATTGRKPRSKTEGKSTTVRKPRSKTPKATSTSGSGSTSTKQSRPRKEKVEVVSTEPKIRDIEVFTEKLQKERKSAIAQQKKMNKIERDERKKERDANPDAIKKKGSAISLTQIDASDRIPMFRSAPFSKLVKAHMQNFATDYKIQPKSESTSENPTPVMRISKDALAAFEQICEKFVEDTYIIAADSAYKSHRITINGEKDWGHAWRVVKSSPNVTEVVEHAMSSLIKNIDASVCKKEKQKELNALCDEMKAQGKTEEERRDFRKKFHAEAKQARDSATKSAASMKARKVKKSVSTATSGQLGVPLADVPSITAASLAPVAVMRTGGISHVAQHVDSALLSAQS